MKENFNHKINQNNYNEDNIEEEFAQLIANISKEVSDEVIKTTAVKSMRELNIQIGEFRSSAPKLITDMKTADQLFSKTKKDVESVLGGFTAEMNKQDAMMKKNLVDIKQQYELLSNGSYAAYKKVMEDQTSQIIKAISLNTNEIYKEVDRATNDIMIKLQKQQKENSFIITQNINNRQNENNILFSSLNEKLVELENSSKNEVIGKLEESFEKATATYNKKSKILIYLIAINSCLLIAILGIQLLPYYPLIMSKL